MLRPMQDPVPGMWLSISHVNRSFSCWISHCVSFLLLPYYRFLSWKLYPSDIKTNLSSSILLDGAANTQTKRMDILKEIHCSQTTATKNQNIAREMSEQTLWRAKSSKDKALSSLSLECLRSSSVLSHEKYRFRSIWPSAEFLTVINNKERCLEMLRKLFFEFGKHCSSFLLLKHCAVGLISEVH